MMKILVCRVWTRQNNAAFVVNFHCTTTNAHFHETTTKFQVGKLESWLRIVCLARKNTFEKGTQSSTHAVGGENTFAVSGLKAPFSLFR